MESFWKQDMEWFKECILSFHISDAPSESASVQYDDVDNELIYEHYHDIIRIVDEMDDIISYFDGIPTYD